ncbi:sensor histidine kinase [Spirillospora sp. CA-128828]|uniref:sensor histidine kinase n=1 Tax=Spirillospora sp. CA-128828 TaxID=3240033 RepID=UPI003D92183B
MRRGFVFDVVAAAVVVVANVLVAGNLLKGRDDFAPWFLSSVFVAVGLGLVLTARRKWPMGSLGAALAISGVATVAGVLWEPFVVVSLGLYLVTVRRGSRPALAYCLGVVSAASLVGQVVHPRWSLVVASCWTAAGLLLTMAAWVIGRTVHARRSDAERLERQREHQIVIDERLRIARELHDVVTHGMGLIAVKAGVANHIAEERPGEAREALRVIEATSREALTEMRRLLGVLRDETDGFSPPALAGLPDMVERVKSAGVRMELSVWPMDVPEGVELAVHRIVQEAVTNVVKHAAPATCRVDVREERGVVLIEVTDDGPGGDVTPGGHGLVGMRERVAMYGGRFEAGPLPERGFRVSATIPYKAQA